MAYQRIPTKHSEIYVALSEFAKKNKIKWTLKYSPRTELTDAQIELTPERQAVQLYGRYMAFNEFHKDGSLTFGPNRTTVDGVIKDIKAAISKRK